MNHLTPDQAARIAQKVYDLRVFTVAQLQQRGATLGCEGLFKVDDETRFTGKSGGYVFRKLSGFGYVAEGAGARQGEILVATRGTNTGFDLLTDAHTGLRSGPSGEPVHIGFQRVWESYAEELRAFLRGKNPTHIHCVGHSLGGGLAMLNADFFSANKLPVSVYTFGCPRVGMLPFSQSLTQRVGAENIHRVSHDTDPVPMVPSWPFLHAPYQGKHYTIARGGMIRIGEHFMDSYIGSVSEKSWASLANARVSVDWSDAVARMWLDATRSGENKIQMYSAAGLNMIAQALRWIIRKAMNLGLVFPICTTAGVALTAVDFLATMVGQTAALSKDLAEDVKSVMGAILQFLGRGAVSVADMTHQFISWVFELLRDTIGAMANRASQGGNSER